MHCPHDGRFSSHYALLVVRILSSSALGSMTYASFLTDPASTTTLGSPGNANHLDYLFVGSVSKGADCFLFGDKRESLKWESLLVGLDNNRNEAEFGV